MEPDLSPQDQIDEEAAIWCARVFGPSSESFDSHAFQSWIESHSAHREAFDAMARTWRQLDGMERLLPANSNAAMPEPAAEAVEEAEDNAGHRLTFDRRRMLAAVAVTGVLAVSGYAYYASRPHSYATENGHRSLVRLDDGSTMTLDGATSARFSEDDTSRTVWLTAGRASFEVAHDPSRPFSVHAGDKIVVAVGTSFSVELLQNEIRANLHSGSVDVIDNGPATGAKRYRLRTAGDHFIAQNGSAPVVTHDNPTDDLAWTKGILAFYNEALPVTVERMNRYSTLQVVLAPGLEKDRVSGIFKAGETEKFVAAACELLDLRAERTGDIIRLTAATP